MVLLLSYLSLSVEHKSNCRSRNKSSPFGGKGRNIKFYLPLCDLFSYGVSNFLVKTPFLAFFAEPDQGGYSS